MLGTQGLSKCITLANSRLLAKYIDVPVVINSSKRLILGQEMGTLIQVKEEKSPSFSFFSGEDSPLMQYARGR